ncbi:hypothetical protein THRCLA_21343 [Thraustotheca clavata]|uniref:PNPLA domain-containing protein n=1 Tax=Thraustotheca clavata TaxID=74557 RepID=A0A1V9ZXI8_9STRA|nr:hypothetical protein THRCLA_21343 [Thraustotheca clavata]
MNVSFGGSGFLLAFHVGVAKHLQRVGRLTQQSCVAGASGGALVAAAIACKVPLVQVEERLRLSAQAMKSSSEKSLRDHVFGHVMTVFPDDLPSPLRLIVATTEVWPNPGRIVHHSHFQSKEDLANIVVASCHIPFYLTTNFALRYQDTWYIDGCVRSLVPKVPNHVGVNVFPLPEFLSSPNTISPNLLGAAFPFKLAQLVEYSLVPPGDETLNELVHWGEEAAKVYLKQQ